MSVIVFRVPFRNILDISFEKCWVQNKLQINKNLVAYAVGQIHLFHNRTRAGSQI